MEADELFYNGKLPSSCHKKKSWQKRLKIMGHSMQQKLRTPKAYFKSLLAKPWRSDHEMDLDSQERKSNCSRRMSFSFLSNSSSSSGKSTAVPQMLKKSSSMDSELESSVLSAIAYCKMTQQVSARKSVCDLLVQ